ncbi:MAG: substrate-binding domain-containing protein [Bacteroidota bacterium]
MIKQEYTLKDIAEMAKVSRGTVDRVIHGRGKVSKETYSRVKFILDKIDYKPNLVARTLRKGDQYRLAVLMPDYRFEIYWKKAAAGVEKAKADYAYIGVKIETYYFNPYMARNFENQYELILANKPDAVLVAPFFYKESLNFLARCHEIDLPCFTFNTQVDNSGVISHIGQDLVQSGKTAASLISRMMNDQDEYLIMHINEQIENSRHMQDKERGFRNHLIDNGIDPKKIHVINIDNINNLEELLLKELKDNNKLNGIYVSTSKVWMIAEIIKKHSLNKVLAGCDLLEENIKFLNEGYIDYLIYQDPISQTNTGISTIVDYLVFNKEVQSKNILPIEIIIKENLAQFI